MEHHIDAHTTARGVARRPYPFRLVRLASRATLNSIAMSVTDDYLADILAELQSIAGILVRQKPTPAGFDPEQQAMAYMKGLALHLKDAGDALLAAAEALRAAGKGHPASLAHQAYKAAHARAHEVLNG